MQNPSLTHHIQLAIIKKMLNQTKSRYSDLKPATVEANLFMYHIKQLMRQGLVEKDGKLYVLTRAGKLFADRATLSSMKIRVQPKIVNILCIKREDGRWLLMRRKHQPFTDYIGFPSGKMHFGEPLLRSAERELSEKAGLTDVPLVLRGNVVMRFKDGDDVVNHIIGYVYYGEVGQNCDVVVNSENFATFFEDEKELFREPCFRGHQDILDHLMSGQFPFFSENEYSSAY